MYLLKWKILKKNWGGNLAISYEYLSVLKCFIFYRLPREISRVTWKRRLFSRLWRKWNRFIRGWWSVSSLDPFFILGVWCVFFWIFVFIFWFGHAIQLAGKILVPPEGIEPSPPAVEVQSPRHWTARKFPSLAAFFVSSCGHSLWMELRWKNYQCSIFKQFL